jgi:hypothetical protein
LDALREGLQLRDQFPQHDIKVQSMKADSSGRWAALALFIEVPTKSLSHIERKTGCEEEDVPKRRAGMLFHLEAGMLFHLETIALVPN